MPLGAGEPVLTAPHSPPPGPPGTSCRQRWSEPEGDRTRVSSAPGQPPPHPPDTGPSTASPASHRGLRGRERTRSRQRGGARAAVARGRGARVPEMSQQVVPLRATPGPTEPARGRACDICPVSNRHGRAGPGLADRCRIQETLAVMWTKARPQRPRWKAETGTFWRETLQGPGES